MASVGDADMEPGYFAAGLLPVLRVLLYRGSVARNLENNTRGVPFRLLVRLGRHSKEAGNEPGLLSAVAFAHPFDLPFRSMFMTS